MNWQANLIPALFFITFALASVFGVIQYRKAKKAQREHHRSASAAANHEPATASGETRQR